MWGNKCGELYRLVMTLQNPPKVYLHYLLADNPESARDGDIGKTETAYYLTYLTVCPPKVYLHYLLEDNPESARDGDIGKTETAYYLTYLTVCA